MLFQHRQLASRLEAGHPLTVDERAQLAALEAGFAPLRVGPRNTRRHHRVRVAARVALRVRGMRHTVDLVDMSPGGVSCCRAPGVTPGAPVELIAEIAHDTYQFKARVVWRRAHRAGFVLGLVFVGSPLLLRNFSQ